MDILESLKHDSIKDVISILDTAFLKGNEMVPQYRAMQIANRAFLAHTAIEKGFKARLEKAGLSYPKSGSQGHDLHGLYQLTKKVTNGKWAGDLANAFKDAVSFYEYDLEMLPYLETLETYLEKVGSSKNFVEMRYWLEDAYAVEEAVEQIHHISLYLHKEVLEALWALVGFDQERLVSERVEREVQRALELELSYSPGTPDEQACNELIQWLQTKPNYRTALRQAVQQDYAIEGISEVGRIRLREAFKRLSKSDNPAFYPPPSADPAVAFYIGTCRDLPSGYSSGYPGAQTMIKWTDESETSAKIFSPGGDMLALITKHVQSRWHVVGLLNHGGVLGKSFEDAQNWIVSQCCKQVTVVAGQQTSQLYICSGDPYLPHSNMTRNLDTTELDEPQELELSFWDTDHELLPGQQVTITLAFGGESKTGDNLKGVVTKVERQKVWITGHKWIGLV